jgi:hypothetical protein
MEDAARCYGNWPGGCQAHGHRGINVTTADIVERTNKDHDRETVRQRDSRDMTGAERCRRAGTDEDKSERADEFGDDGLGGRSHSHLLSTRQAS